MNYQLINQPNKELSVVQQVLYNRGFKIEDIPHYLNTTDADILPPTWLDNIDKGIKMLFEAIDSKKQIAMCVDCD